MGDLYKCKDCGEVVSTVGQCCTDGQGRPKKSFLTAEKLMCPIHLVPYEESRGNYYCPECILSEAIEAP